MKNIKDYDKYTSYFKDREKIREDIKKLLQKIKDDNHEIVTGKNNITIKDKSTDYNLLFIDYIDDLKTVIYYYEIGPNDEKEPFYKNLFEYLLHKLSNIISEEGKLGTMKFMEVGIDFTNYKYIENIDISKEDYEIFTDSNKFGL